MQHSYKMILPSNGIVYLIEKDVFTITYLAHFPEQSVGITEFYFLGWWSPGFRCHSDFLRDYDASHANTTGLIADGPGKIYGANIISSSSCGSPPPQDGQAGCSPGRLLFAVFSRSRGGSHMLVELPGWD